jgi:hypothetical protein
LGRYSIQAFLGSINGDPVAPAVISKGPPSTQASFSVAIGIHGISNLREILQMDSTFKVAPDIKIDLKRNIEYYRVSLVTDFFHRSKDIKITYALLKVQLVSSSDTIKPEIYSISLLRVK